MARVFQDKKTNLTAQVDVSEFKRIARYCKQNNIRISDLIRRGVRREMESGGGFEVMAEVEKMIDSKIEEKLKIVEVTAKKIN